MNRTRFDFAGGLAALLLAPLVAFAAPTTPAPAPPPTADFLATTPSWTAEADQASASFGSTVATAGDVNGDGYSDVIVGADVYDVNGTQAGAAFVYYGSAGGPSPTPSWSVDGDPINQYLGHAVAAAGDVNGDGYGDVIISAYLGSTTHTLEGRVLVFHGSATGLGATPAWTAQGTQTVSLFGASVASAGDVNGDGYDDVIVGAPGFDNGQQDEGRVYVYYGSAGGLSLTPSWIMGSGVSGAQFGSSVSTAGDVNGDGYDEVIIGAERYSNGQLQEGRAFVFNGSSGGLVNLTGTAPESNEAGARFGASVSTAGDVNGDGYADVIIGAPGSSNGQAGEGRAFLYKGSALGISAAASWVTESNQANAGYGVSVATAGDVNGDGFADVVVGADFYDDGQTDEGYAAFYYGYSGGLSPVPLWTETSDQVSSRFGASVATAGDVNGDGYSDVLVGAWRFTDGESQEGAAFAYFGANWGGADLYPLWAFESNQPLANLGAVVAGIGDVNGDGYSDIVATAPQWDNGQFDEGRASVFYGSSIGPSFSESFVVESNQSFALLGFGTSAAGAGDVNGDGYSDLIVGMPYYDDGQTDEGRVQIHVGSPTGLHLPIYFLTQTNEADAHFGISVAGAGDVNGDGYGDVIIGAEQASNGEFREGRAYVLHGSASGLTVAWTGEPDQESALYGHVVAGAGDVNGDGYSDVIVGAERYDGGLTDEGRVYVYHGSPSGLGAVPAWTYEPDQAFAGYGSTVASAGDVNGDGYSDVIVGAHNFNGDVSGEGCADLFLGSASGLAANPAWSVGSNQVGGGTGVTVASAGDINGDGYSDVIVGWPELLHEGSNQGGAFAYHGGKIGPDTISDWSAFGGQANAAYGNSVACAGDANGDGYSDLIVGAWLDDNGHTNEGRVTYYNGNLVEGLDRTPRQSRSTGSAPIALLGRSDSETAFQARALGRSTMGRGPVWLEVEAKPLGVPFDGSGIVVGATTNTGAPGASGSAVTIKALVDGLMPGSPYRWRSRIASRDPFFLHSPWFVLAGNGAGETDLRTGGTLVAVSDLHAPGGAAFVRLSPNPSFGKTRIEFDLAHAGPVRVTVHDVRGRLVARLLDETRGAGRQAVAWNGESASGRAVAAGIYFVRVEIEGRIETSRLVRIRS